MEEVSNGGSSVGTKSQEESDDEDIERLKNVTKHQDQGYAPSKRIPKLEKVHNVKPTTKSVAVQVALESGTSSAKPSCSIQAPFQPGSTHQQAGKRRFLAYNLIGSITSCESDGSSHVEVEFHDTSQGLRVPAFNDHFGFTMAALSEKGSVYANPRKGGKVPSTLVYRPFTSWANNSEWSMRFPLNEEVTAVAIGSSWAAAATCLNHLRIFSETGLQKFLLCLTGPIVAMASYQDLLAVVHHADSSGQVMGFMVLSVAEQQRVLSGCLPLTPGASLSWVGFSESGVLSTYDSQGILRIFNNQYGGCWIPVFSVSDEQKTAGESCWVVGLNSTQVYCVKCRAIDPQPQVLPKPVLTLLNLSLPLVCSDLGAADLENQLVRDSLLLSETRVSMDLAAALGQGDDDDDEAEQVLKMEAQLDRCILRLIAASCEGDKLARALELATMLSLNKSLEGAIKLVNAMKLPSLAERLNMMLEGKRKFQTSVAAATNLNSRSESVRSQDALVTHRFSRTVPGNGADQETFATSIVQKTLRRNPASFDGTEIKLPLDSKCRTESPSPPKLSSVLPKTPISMDEKSGVKSLNPNGKSANIDNVSGSRALNPFAKTSKSKEDEDTSNMEVSVLDSLKKLQGGVDGKRKVISSESAKNIRTGKATKARLMAS